MQQIQRSAEDFNTACYFTSSGGCGMQQIQRSAEDFNGLVGLRTGLDANAMQQIQRSAEDFNCGGPAMSADAYAHAADPEIC